LCRCPDSRLRIHHGYAAANQVIDIAEAPRLAAVAEDRDVVAAQGLHDEIRYHAAILAVHARAIGIENAHDLDVERVLAVVVEEQGLGAALALVVAGTDPDGIDL